MTFKERDRRSNFDEPIGWSCSGRWSRTKKTRMEISKDDRFWRRTPFFLCWTVRFADDGVVMRWCFAIKSLHFQGCSRTFRGFYINFGGNTWNTPPETDAGSPITTPSISLFGSHVSLQFLGDPKIGAAWRGSHVMWRLPLGCMAMGYVWLNMLWKSMKWWLNIHWFDYMHFLGCSWNLEAECVCLLGEFSDIFNGWKMMKQYSNDKVVPASGILLEENILAKTWVSQSQTHFGAPSLNDEAGIGYPWLLFFFLANCGEIMTL